MVNTAPKTQLTFTPKLQRRLEEHKAEVARLRAEIGDVDAALDALIRKMFDFEAIEPELMHADGVPSDLDDEDDDYLDGW
jgi:hypothetical protein